VRTRAIALIAAVLAALLLAGCQVPLGATRSAIGGSTVAPTTQGSMTSSTTTAPLPSSTVAATTAAAGPMSPWSDPQTWGGQVPAPGSDVTIPAGRAIVLDVNVDVRSLTVLGSLSWGDTDGLELRAGHVMVHGPGAFRVGSPTQPFARKATITLTGNDPGENVMGMGSKFFGAMMGGVIEIYGEDRVDWTRLAATAATGATQITLAENADWRVGESIVIASTMLDPAQAEQREITAVSGSTVTLDAPLTYQHWGTVQAFDGGRVQADQRAEVGLLSRNIVIQGDDGSAAANFGGHMMIMGSDPTTIETNPAARSSAKVRGVEFRRMGQFDRLGRYPFHWHLNGDSTGDFLEGSAVHDSLQRGVVVHGTSNVRIADNVVYNTPGHAISIETGAEYDNVIDANLAMNPRPVTFTQATLKTQGDDRAAAYWIKGVNNVFTDNVAAGGAFGGFWFDDPDQNAESRLTFTGNSVHSHASSEGAGVWLQGRRLNFSQLSFSGLNVYKNGTGFWPDNDSPATVTDSSFADNKVAATGDVNVVRSSIVGRTANLEVIGPVFNERWGGAGVRVYNNAASMTDVTFVNFTADAAAVSTVACRNESVRFRAQGIRWINAAPSYCAGDTIVTDVDGSFGMTGKPSIIVSDPIMFTSDLGCTTRPDNGTVCPPTVNYPYLFVKRDFSITPSITVTRNFDGLAQTSTAFPGLAVTIPGKSYSLSRGPADVPAMNLYLAQGRKNGIAGLTVNAASRVVIALPAPTAEFKAWRSVVDGCYTCGFNTTDAKLRTRALTPVPSMAALTTADREGYFYDSSAKTLYLLLGPDKPVFLERTN